MEDQKRLAIRNEICEHNKSLAETAKCREMYIFQVGQKGPSDNKEIGRRNYAGRFADTAKEY